MGKAHCWKCGTEFELASATEFEPGVEIDLSIESLCKSCAKQHKLSHDPSEILRRILKDVPQVAPIPGYTVIKLLAQWGMESMYLATRDRDGAKVAIKVMPASAWMREREKECYRREIDVSMALKHPNIVRCYEHGSAGSTLFLVMELCEGGSVDGLMKDFGGKLPVDIARPIVLQSLEGLAYAHDSGYVHRNMKPANILLTAKRGAIAKIANWDLAKSFERDDFVDRSGTVAGTWSYMPREQLLSFEYVKPPTDVWSMGATLYCMLTGMAPREVMQGRSPQEMILKGRVVPIRDRDGSIPKNLEAVIDKALSGRPEDRYHNAREFLTALRGVWGPAAP